MAVIVQKSEGEGDKALLEGKADGDGQIRPWRPRTGKVDATVQGSCEYARMRAFRCRVPEAAMSARAGCYLSCGWRYPA